VSAAFALPAEADHWAEAAAFVLSLRARGISDLPLLRAMETVPREVFAPRRYADLARQDIALPLPCGETMTAPTTVGLMLAALRLRPGQRVLEIGTGSGYVTCLLVALGGAVRSVERRAVLLDSALQRLRTALPDHGSELACEDGLRPDPLAPRLDRILVNGAFPGGNVPASLTDRLVVGGRLVAGALAPGGAASLLVIERGTDGHVACEHGPRIRLGRIHERQSAAFNGSLTPTGL
jgi:protein-L-isoaspartate(D-aspartate) O-methyltransferase